MAFFRMKRISPVHMPLQAVRWARPMLAFLLLPDTVSSTGFSGPHIYDGIHRPRQIVRHGTLNRQQREMRQKGACMESTEISEPGPENLHPPGRSTDSAPTGTTP